LPIIILMCLVTGTSLPLEQISMDQLTFLSEEPLVSHSASQDSEADWMMTVATSRLSFLDLLKETRAKWLVWENVPGVLSSNAGRDFGSILGGLVELGYGFAYRVLDAQYFGVAQRRRRVFVIGCLGDTASAAAVLFERHSLQGHSAPRREKGKEVAGTLTRSAFEGGAGGKPDGAAVNHFVAWPAEIAPTLNAHFGEKMGLENQHIAGGGGLFVSGEMPDNWSGTEIRSRDRDLNPHARRRLR
jgi:site-specific DNA-cytosine methylase